MKRVLDLAEFQTLSRCENGPANRGSGNIAANVDRCVDQGLAERHNSPGYFNSNEFRITETGKQALKDSRSH